MHFHVRCFRFRSRYSVSPNRIAVPRVPICNDPLRSELRFLRVPPFLGRVRSFLNWIPHPCASRCKSHARYATPQNWRDPEDPSDEDLSKSAGV